MAGSGYCVNQKINDKEENVIRRYLYAAALGLALLALAGCGGNAYERVFNNDQTINARSFNASSEDCYLAAKRAVLDQDFTIEAEDSQARDFKAIRYFPSGKDSTVLEMSINVIGSDKTKIYASAIQYVDKVRTKTQTTLLGLVPIGSSATKVKQNEESIEDKDFYNRFFEAVEKELKSAGK